MTTAPSALEVAALQLVATQAQEVIDLCWKIGMSNVPEPLREEISKLDGRLDTLKILTPEERLLKR